MSYIVKTDITDNVINGFDCSLPEYLTETDAELVSLAESLGVISTEIQSAPLHRIIKRYAICYTLMRLCQDKAGTNDVEITIETDRYMVKYRMYRDECEELRPQISREMFIGSISEIRDRAAVSGTLYRG